MIGFYLIYPHKIEVVDTGASYEGNKTLSTSDNTDLEIVLLESGSVLKKSGDVFNVKAVRGNASFVGGKHNKRVRPPPEGLMPRNFVDPFSFVYSFKEAPQNHEWIGQNSKGVTDFKRWQVRNLFGDITGQVYNERLFEYGGDLFLLGEQFEYVGKGAGGSAYDVEVAIWKYDSENEFFRLLKRFTERKVDDNAVDSVQTGSPDWIVHNDELFIFYRSVDRNTQTNSVVCWSTTDKDLLDWNFISETQILDTRSVSYDRDRFRLRAAVGNDIFMIVYYGIDVVNVPGPGNIEIKDFRTLLSFDYGFSFKTNQKSYKNIVGQNYWVSTDPTIARENSITFSFDNSKIYNLFVPEFVSDGTELDYTGFTIKFDLFFDKNIGSFILIKPGDPYRSVKDANSYLMGLKTVDNDYFSWELAFQYELNFHATGITNNINDPYDEALGITFYPVAGPKYFIEDLVVIEDDGIHTLIMAVDEATVDTSTANQYQTTGVTISEFKLIRSEQIPPGFYEDMFAYGVKNHPDVIFLSSLINVEYCGVITRGMRHLEQNDIWDEIIGCKWRNQIVSSARRITDLNQRPTRKFLAIHAPWSNVGELIPYQHSYCRWEESVLNAEWLLTTTGSGGFSYSAGAGTNTFTTVGGTDTSYISLDTTLSSNKNTVERAGGDWYTDFKIKFQFECLGFSSVASEFTEILVVRLGGSPSGNEQKFSLRVYGDGGVGGELRLYDDTPTLIDTLGNIDFNKEYEILIKYGKIKKSVTTDQSFSVWIRDGSDPLDFWTHIGNDVVYTPTGTPSGSGIEIGILSYNNQVGQDLRVGDIHIGTSSPLYRPLFSEGKRAFGSRLEGAGKFYTTHINDFATANNIELYTNELVLIDGSRVRITGDVSGPNTILYNYSKSAGRNSVKNVVNGLAASVFEFTNIHNVVNGTQIVFRNTHLKEPDSLSLINMVGVTHFDVISGTYNETTESFTTSTVESYEVPYDVIDVVSSSDNIVITSQEFQPSELVGYTFALHDGATYTDALRVVENYDVIIEFDQTVPSLVGKELRLLYPSGTFIIKPSVGLGKLSHLAVKLFTPLNFSTAAIGEIVFGKLYDLTKEVSEFSEGTFSNFGIIESDRGFLYMENTDLTSGVAAAMEGNIIMPQLSVESQARYILDLFNSLAINEKGFPIVLIDDDNASLTKYVVINDKIQMVPNNYRVDVNVPILQQWWEFQAPSDFVNEPPSLQIFADKSEVEIAETVTLKAVGEDPEGTAVTYDWDHGDGNFSDGTFVDLSTHTLSYAALGEYVVTCFCNDEDGQTTVKRLKIYVNVLGLDHYVQGHVGSLTVPTTITITITAEDRDNNTLTRDNATTGTIIKTSGAGTFDLTADIFSLPGPLVDGVYSADYSATAAGTHDFVWYDDFGRILAFSIVFV